MDSSHLLVRCLAVVEESHDVKTFWLERADGEPLRYRAGQFLTLSLPKQATSSALRRCYTLSSAPTTSNDRRFSITVKAKPGGVASNWLHANLRPGVTLEAAPPAGVFCLQDRRPRKLLMVCGGVGITPLLSMTRWLAEAPAAHSPDVCFIQCARSTQDFLFLSELRRLHEAGLVRLHLLPATADESWSGPSGLIDEAFLARACPDLASRQLYCCGPDPFMQRVRGLWTRLGGPPAAYFEERFVVESAQAESNSGHDGSAGARASVVFARSAEVNPDAGQLTILEAARAAGVVIPSSCEAGICGTCKVRKLSGEVSMAAQGGIEDEELDAGWILACCSRPIGSVSIDA